MHKQPHWKSLGAPAPHVAEKEAAAAEEFFRRREALRLVVAEPEAQELADVVPSEQHEDELADLRSDLEDARNWASEEEAGHKEEKGRADGLAEAIRKALRLLGKLNTNSTDETEQLLRDALREHA